MTDSSKRLRGSQAELVTIGTGGDELLDQTVRPLLEKGATVGRYVVLSTLGRGGMGVVYAAYDPELDRKIALKLLRPGTGGQSKAVESHARLLREAQALARLSHPNVVTIHDVGTVDDEVFIAMEYIDGVSLGVWVARRRERESSARAEAWREVLDVFRKAGQGLAAAHAAGLIHRDFKPENVLVGADGRVRVLDFGLARAAGEIEVRERGTDARDDLGVSSTTFESILTRTGAVMGTPGYMAPEQHVGGTVDARTDIFGFCVALYEALYGERPFAGRSMTALVANVLAGDVKEPPKDSDVPGWLRRAVLRGLALDPSNRPATMDELLRSLAHDPRHRLRRASVLAALVLGLGVGGLALGLTLREGEPPQCRVPEERMTGVWDGPRRESARAAFAAVDRPYAAQAFEHSAAQLDAYVDDWREGWAEACEATRVHGEQSDALLDLRMGCLQHAVLELRAVTDLLVTADATVVEHATDMVAALPELAECRDLARLTARVPPPDSGTAASVEAVQAQLAHVRALESAGKFREAIEPAKQVSEAARASGYAPLQAHALLLLGRLQENMDDAEASAASLAQALNAAVRGGDDELAARVTSEMIYVLGYRLLRKQAALERAEESAAWIVRLGGDDRLESDRLDRLSIVLREFGQLADARAAVEEALELRRRIDAGPAMIAESLAQLAVVEGDEGKLQDAIAHLREALALKQAIHGDHHPSLVAVLNNLGVYEQRLGNFDAARAHFERVRSIYELAVGPRCAGVALALTNLGALASEQGQLALAITHLRLAKELYIEARGPEHSDVAAAINSLAIALASDHQFEEATAAFLETLALKRKLFGDDSSNVAFAENNVGNVLVDQGKYEEGLVHLRKALEMKRRLLGEDHVTVASTLDTMGFAIEGQARCDDALVHYREALAIYEAAMGPDNVRVTNALLGIGRCLVAQGHAERALEPLERAHRIRAGGEGDPVDLADARVALARALWASNRDRDRAKQLAAEAEPVYVEAGKRAEQKLAALREWSNSR
jgi:tetratricopeptide (TPR) repeat protein/tRNA A-37 threonylcarbamoyl transferase component Bud32